MMALLPADGEPVHAETLLSLCLADGLLEVLEWSREGTGADPQASMWLSCLRWYRLVTGHLPEVAPQPPQRPSDYALELILRAGGLTLTDGSADASLRGLASGQMAYPTDPPQPEHDDDDALTRVVPISLVPYVEAETRAKWADEAICLTHGHPRLREQARQRARTPVSDQQPEPHRHELLATVVADLAQRWRGVTLP